MVSLRPDLAEVEPYDSPQLPATRRMNTNESPYGPPESVVEALQAALRDAALNRYPDRDAVALTDALAARWAWPRAGVWIANGSNEVLMHVFLAFGGPGRSALTFEPSYNLHSLIPRIALTDVVHLRRGGAFEIDAAAAVAHVEEHRPDVVVVCSPNNPTGSTAPRDLVEGLLRAAPGLVVVDEAYAEFAPADASAVPLLPRHENLVVVRTFSKAWSLAGMRLGYMLAAPDLVRKMAVVKLPYHLSVLAQAAGVAVLAAEEETMRCVQAIVSERERMVRELRALRFRVVPSDANFLLFGTDVIDGELLQRCLHEEGVLVRAYPNVPALREWARVTVGLPEDNEDFLRTLGSVMA
ncbi:MAG: histidinol-phosphate transaminase [Actinomycetota bacterium]